MLNSFFKKKKKKKKKQLKSPLDVQFKGLG